MMEGMVASNLLYGSKDMGNECHGKKENRSIDGAVVGANVLGKIRNLDIREKCGNQRNMLE